MPTAQANGINIYYEARGEGEPMVLISGLGYGLWQWHKMVTGLAEHFHVIAFDNRGAGQTDKPAGPYDVRLMAADTLGLMDALGVGTAIVVGHSMGGFIAQELALSAPERVSGLVLASTNFGGPNHIPVSEEAMQAMTDRSGSVLDVVRRGVEVACAPGYAARNPKGLQELIEYRMGNPVPPEAYQAQMAVGLGLIDEANAFEGRLKNVQAPALILFGEHDRVVPPGNADLLAGQIPNSSVKILPGAGHLFPIEAPDAAVEAIVGWVEEVEGAI